MKYICYEPDFTGEYSLPAMRCLYLLVVDKKEYPDFDCWLTDMLRSGVFVTA